MANYLVIRLEVEDDIKAYEIVNKLNFRYNVIEADYLGKKYEFSKEDKSKLPKHFLRNEFGDKEILK